ncbi:ribosomal protein L28e [Cryphonectria parasitica EP155]|uniref:Ribosomal protein L28e n=1 Tax=Cryphonectria parasitica (strain ATCC 38755 / EP155) TaxID=660469 RepID=A0A9P4YAA5_CRYP1|nr:ribosomal protein L28e [Cryphonectria parasitica EP155]KAF3769666.1 ribosomal protein L28e [Cryphonectria parasitica EP155]
MSLPNVSSDLVWEIVRHNNSFLVKRKQAGGVQFSRDPFNLLNKHSRKHAGFVNDKAVSISTGGEKGVVFQSKKAKSVNQPAKAGHKTTFGGHNRKTYKNVANHVAKGGYRPDLRQAAIARASAIKKSQRPVKPDQEKKLRGNAAKRAAASE